MWKRPELLKVTFQATGDIIFELSRHFRGAAELHKAEVSLTMPFSHCSISSAAGPVDIIAPTKKF